MKKAKLQVDPLHGSVLRSMLLFALPIMGTAFLQMLFTSVDTMVLGKFGMENSMAAVGASASVISLIITAVSGLGTGVSIVVGARTGRGEQDSVAALLHSLPLTALLIGLTVTILAGSLAEPILLLVHCPPGLLPDALLYFRIYFLSLPFMLTFTVLSSVLQARGASFQPFVIQVSCGALNLGLNLLFVIACGWNVVGVAVATVISQAVSAGAMLFYFVRMERELPLSLKKLRVFAGFGQVLRLGIPASLGSVLMNLSGVIIQTAINDFPETVISGNTVSASIEGLICVAFVGFSSAGMVFVSQNAAVGDMARTRRVQRCATLTALLLGEALGFLIYALSDLVIGLYTDVPAIAEIAKLRMLYMCLPYGLCGAMNVMGGCVQGLGNTRIPLVISILSSCVFRVLWIYLYARPRGTISAIYISYPLCWLLATSLYLVAFALLLKKKRAMLAPAAQE